VILPPTGTSIGLGFAIPINLASGVARVAQVEGARCRSA
jgi:S1-C subfamily serine protease